MTCEVKFDLKESEEKALRDLKTKLEEAIVENTLFKKKKEIPVKVEKKKNKTKSVLITTVEEEEEDEMLDKDIEAEEEEDETVDKDIELWGVPLLPSKGAQGTDVILLKLLRARDFKVNEAFEILKLILLWRKIYNTDSILGEDFEEPLVSAYYMNGVDRGSRPVCYNVHSVFGNEELYKKTFESEKSRDKLFRRRIQLMEKEVKKLDLKPGGVTSVLQIHDIKNCPIIARKQIWCTNGALVGAVRYCYPGFVFRNIFINAPFWFYACDALMSLFIPQRNKLVVARPAKVTETLLKYIPAEEIPVQYGGFKRDDDTEFSNEAVSEVVVKPRSTKTIEIPAPKVEGTLVWDIAVLGWEVSYKEEFVPTDEGAYTVIVQKGKKIGSNEGGPMRSSFKNSESGKIVLTVDNVSSKKKKRVLYRYKTKTESSSQST